MLDKKIKTRRLMNFKNRCLKIKGQDVYRFRNERKYKVGKNLLSETQSLRLVPTFIKRNAFN